MTYACFFIRIHGLPGLWRQTLKAHGSHLSRSTTESMECMLKNKRVDTILEEKTGDHNIV